MDRKQQGREMIEQHGKQVVQLLERLNEQHRRHVLGLMSVMLGRGGDSFLYEQFGVNRRTVRKGRRELLAGFEDVPDDKLRRPGGGRPTLEKKVHRSKRPSRKQSNRMSEDCHPANENGPD
jgi:hypothetical protein